MENECREPGNEEGPGDGLMGENVGGQRREQGKARETRETHPINPFAIANEWWEAGNEDGRRVGVMGENDEGRRKGRRRGRK